MPFDCPSWPPQWPEIDEAVAEVVRSGDWGRYHSNTCAELQETINGLYSANSVWLSCSGTAALDIALRAARIGAGDRVVLAAYDFPGNFRTVELSGAKPVLLDVAPDRLSLDPNQLSDLASHDNSKQIRAVIASHLYGRAAEITAIREICDAHGWLLLEDACQVPGMTIAQERQQVPDRKHGNERKHDTDPKNDPGGDEVSARPAGSFGDAAILSFGGSKPLSAGAGGALLVKDSRLAARVPPLIDRPGEVFPMSPLQAAVLLPQWRRLAESNQLRRETVRYLETNVNPRLPRWEWLSATETGVEPSYYKVGWLAESAAHRARLLDASQAESLPIGPGFRSMSACSTRRCDKPVATPRSDRLSESTLVLDHRALLLSPDRYEELAEALLRVEKAAA